MDVDKSNENDIESNSDKNIGNVVVYVVLAKIILLDFFIIVRKCKKHTQQEEQTKMRQISRELDKDK